MGKSKISTQENIRKIYAPLVGRFAKELKGLDVWGVQAPHLPIAGTNCDSAMYKFAFVGMETYGWASLDDFLSIAEKSPEQAAVEYSRWLNDEGVIGHRGPATFFGFIINFLAEFYHVDYRDLVNIEKHNPLLTSYVWGNSNSIERYGVTAKGLGASPEAWLAVKESSRAFDSVDHLIKAAHPKVILLTYKYVSDSYLLKETDTLGAINTSDDLKKSVFRYRPDKECNYEYVYLREQQTHVFILPHPTWIGKYGGSHKKYIDSIISVLKSLRVWDSFPNSQDDWRIPEKSIGKYEYIAKVADFLVQNDMVMTGQQLAMLLNTNGIKKTDGSKFTEQGGVGIHHVISCAYHYYHKRGDRLTALKIARAFVNKYGHYAY